VTSDVSRLRALYMGTFRDANEVMAKNDLRSCGSRTRCSQFPCGPSGDSAQPAADQRRHCPMSGNWATR